MCDDISQFSEIEPSWKAALAPEFTKPYMAKLANFLFEERKGDIPIYPPANLVFNAFWQTPYNKVKVLIMGQDPYHGPNQAHGLCFSVPEGVPPPPSLQNIFKELKADLGIPKPKHGCLLSWARQGVMLLNATLTVREKDPLSHHNKGWETFTDAVIEALCKRSDPVIFVLWGMSAQMKCLYIKGITSKEFILVAAHPSPFSAHRGFFGCNHFSKINALLLNQNKQPIDWHV